LGGLLVSAAGQYVEAKAAFRKLAGDQDELAMLLTNLAHVYARQGRMALASPLAHEALRINEEIGNDYSTGLVLSNLAMIARMRGNYPQAVMYGEEALALFRDLEDSHGIVLAYLSIVQAQRRMAKHQLETGRKLDNARKSLEEADRSLEKALEEAEKAGLGADIPDLRAEQGRVYRELGHIVRRLEGAEEGLGYYLQSERQLRRALEAKEWGALEKADTLQDIAETLFFSGDEKTARKRLQQIEELIGEAHRIIPGERVPEPDAPHEHFAPLGKVEMTRGQMAFTRGDPEQGLQHYILAYAYLMHFSTDAVEKDTLLEYLYNRLRILPIERQQALLASISAWIQEHDTGVDVEPFVQTLKSLLGV
jgi:tetratricopeptide (TPR) repeat protein